MDDSLKEKLHSIKRLAIRGVGGEKVNAQVLFAALCAKHGIDPEQLSETSRHWFPYRSELDRLLLIQLCWVVSRRKCSWTRRRWKQVGADLTETQAVELEFCFLIYRRQLKREMGTLFSAFIHRHDLFGPAEGKTSREISEKEFEETRRMLAMSRTLEEVRIRKPLPEK